MPDTPKPPARAAETISAFADGHEPEDERLAELARAADEQPGALDGPLGELSGIRRRALVRRLRELAGAGAPDHEALAELADRIEELPGGQVVGADEELLLLRGLLARPGQSEEELAGTAGAAGGHEGTATARWAADAADRGLIELVEPGGPLRRWQMTDAGRRALGVPSAR